MMGCKLIRDKEGVDGVLTADSFNDVICALDKLIDAEGIKQEFRDGYEIMRKNLLRGTKFDPVNEEAHIRMNLWELSLYSLMLLLYLPDYEKDYFKERLGEDGVKIWHTGKGDSVYEYK